MSFEDFSPLLDSVFVPVHGDTLSDMIDKMKSGKKPFFDPDGTSIGAPIAQHMIASEAQPRDVVKAAVARQNREDTYPRANRGSVVEAQLRSALPGENISILGYNPSASREAKEDLADKLIEPYKERTKRELENPASWGSLGAARVKVLTAIRQYGGATGSYFYNHLNQQREKLIAGNMDAFARHLADTQHHGVINLETGAGVVRSGVLKAIGAVRFNLDTQRFDRPVRNFPPRPNQPNRGPQPPRR